MSLIICPGIHDPELTEGFLKGLRWEGSNQNLLIFPAHDYPAYSAIDIWQFLCKSSVNSPVVFISFSAGVVGAIGAAWMWQLSGRSVKAFIAVDGWGVPLSGNFPIHRISHDYFTYWSSAVLGTGEDSFYADPSVEHLELWRSPEIAQGWWVSSGSSTQTRTYTTAAEFLTCLLQRYGNE